MDTVQENSNAVAGKLLRIAGSAASDHTPDGGLIQANARHNELPHYTGLCSGVLREARSLAAAGRYGPVLMVLLARASDLLDDIDEFLVAMNPLRDADAYLLAAELHRSLEQIQARLPRQFRGRAVNRR